MRHQKHHASLGVTREHRAAMLANLAASLITHGRIQTTLTKAKALRPFIEKVITLAKKGDLHHRRLAMARVRDEDAVTLLFNEKAKQFEKRPGGYTRIYKISQPRISDAAELALIEFVAADDPGYRKSRPAKKSKGRKAAPAAEAPAVSAAPAEAAPAAAPAQPEAKG